MIFYFRILYIIILEFLCPKPILVVGIIDRQDDKTLCPSQGPTHLTKDCFISASYRGKINGLFHKMAQFKNLRRFIFQIS